MIYAVKAKYVAENLAELRRRVLDGSIAKRMPDGPEVAASMRRARVTEPGVVRWTEECFCTRPLEHERATVLDRYFRGMVVLPVDSHLEFEGEPLMEFIARGGWET